MTWIMYHIPRSDRPWAIRATQGKGIMYKAILACAVVKLIKA